ETLAAKQAGTGEISLFVVGTGVLDCPLGEMLAAKPAGTGEISLFVVGTGLRTVRREKRLRQNRPEQGKFPFLW
ncbi:MAG: hypothetical protein IJY20_04980, partial [Clostridia bacterium]|nr:hypothetical protein [Clostridia bacterium]